MTKCFTDVTLDLAMELIKMNGFGLVKPTLLSIDPYKKTTRLVLESDHIEASLEGKVVHFSLTHDPQGKMIVMAKEV